MAFVKLCILFFFCSKARTTPLEDVLQFKAEFEKDYGAIHPTFYQGSYSQVRIEMYNSFIL